MSAISEDAYVVCWRRGRQPRFALDSNWPTARELFECRLVENGESAERHRAAYGQLTEEGRGVSYGDLGIYHAHQVGDSAPEPELFLRVWGRNGLLPVVGSKSRLIQLANRLDRAEVTYEKFFPASSEEIEEAPKPPSESNPSARARRRLKALLERRGSAPSAENLTAGELIYVAEGLRGARRFVQARSIAERLARTKATPGRLNLKGSVLRDLGMLDASAESYRESMALCDSAERNPFAYIGLSATLRRLRRLEEAYDLVRRPLRHYPDNRYALETQDAIYRDLRRFGDK
jgi:tetratricopeptide (TPR) repeat protein